jgi:hypothetical protein
MAAARDKILGTLNEFIAVTTQYERDQPPYYSYFARQHLDYWHQALSHSPDLVEIDVDELGARVTDARRLLGGYPEDFEHAIIGAFDVSERLFRTLPGGRDTPLPKPKPKPLRAPAYALDR